jgi:hypothetical protein
MISGQIAGYSAAKKDKRRCDENFAANKPKKKENKQSPWTLVLSLATLAWF